MKNNQRIALTKRLLHEALLKIMERKPLDKINVSELCAEAGINRATFYRHYNVPRDVLTDMQAQFTEHLQAVLDTAGLMKAPHKYAEQLCTQLYENAALVKIFILNNSEEDIICLFDDFFLTMLKENKELAGDRPLDNDEVKLISAYLSGGGYFLLRRWLLDGIGKTPEEIADLVMSIAGTELRKKHLLAGMSLQA